MNTICGTSYHRVLLLNIKLFVASNASRCRMKIVQLSRKYQTKLFIKYLITFHILLLHSLIDTLLCAIVRNVYKDLSVVIDVDVNVII